MSASQRVQVLADKAEELSLLAEFLKNPNLITNLQEEIKKLNSLTADEEAKLLQARIDLKEHNNKMFALKKERELLDSDKADHEKHVSSTSVELTNRSQSLDALAQTLHDMDTRQNAKDKSHAEERKQLDAQAATLKKNTEAAEKALLAREEKVHSAEARNEQVRLSLESDKKKLAEKLRLLQAE